MLYFAAVVASAVGPKRSLKSRRRFNSQQRKKMHGLLMLKLMFPFRKRCRPCVLLPEERHATRGSRLWEVAWPENTFPHPVVVFLAVHNSSIGDLVTH